MNSFLSPRALSAAQLAFTCMPCYGAFKQAYFSTVRQVQRRPVVFFGLCVGSYIFMQTLVCVLFVTLPLETVLVVHSFSVAILGFTISVGFVYFR